MKQNLKIVREDIYDVDGLLQKMYFQVHDDKMGFWMKKFKTYKEARQFVTKQYGI